MTFTMHRILLLVTMAHVSCGFGISSTQSLPRLNGISRNPLRTTHCASSIVANLKDNSATTNICRRDLIRNFFVGASGFLVFGANPKLLKSVGAYAETKDDLIAQAKFIEKVFFKKHS